MAERGSAWLGIGWIVWCAVAMVVVLGGGSAAFERYVVVPHCIEVCEEAGSPFARFRVGSRGGPSSACMCADERAIETSLADTGTFCAAMAFLACCYGPFAILSIRDRRRKAQARPSSKRS